MKNDVHKLLRGIWWSERRARILSSNRFSLSLSLSIYSLSFSLSWSISLYTYTMNYIKGMIRYFRYLGRRRLGRRPGDHIPEHIELVRAPHQWVEKRGQTDDIVNVDKLVGGRVQVTRGTENGEPVSRIRGTNDISAKTHRQKYK